MAKKKDEEQSQTRYDVIHMHLGEVTKREENVTKKRAKQAFSHAYDTGGEAVIILKDGERMTMKEMISMTAANRKNEFVLDGSAEKK